MRKLFILGMSLVLIAGFSVISEAKVLFSDNFEAGLSKDWVFSDRGGQDAWKVITEKGNKIHKRQGMHGL